MPKEAECLCPACGDVVTGKHPPKGVCEKCLPDNKNRARCKCGKEFVLEDNDLTKLHPDLYFKDLEQLEPDKTYYFILNACVHCDPDKKVVDLAAKVFEFSRKQAS